MLELNLYENFPEHFVVFILNGVTIGMCDYYTYEIDNEREEIYFLNKEGDEFMKLSIDDVDVIIIP